MRQGGGGAPGEVGREKVAPGQIARESVGFGFYSE